MSIMVAYDGSEASKEALSLAKAHAKAFKEEIEVVRAVERTAELDYANIRRLEQNLEDEIKPLMRGENIRFKTTLLVSSSTGGEEIDVRVRLGEGYRNSTHFCVGCQARDERTKLDPSGYRRDRTKALKWMSVPGNSIYGDSGIES